MDSTKLNALARSLRPSAFSPSRRRLLSGLVGSVTALALLDDTDARKCSKKKRKAGLCGGNTGGGTPPPPYTGQVFTVSGRTILDTAGKSIQLRGVNKMAVFDDGDPRGNTYFAEIAKSKSNTVRIVWAIKDDNGPTDVTDLAALIANCQANKMLPMIELHDATGDLSRLPQLGNYWARNDVLQVIFNAGGNLLVNIGNEVGDDTVTANQWVSAYTPVIRQLRQAGIRTPLVIDAPDFGKNLDVVVAGAGSLLAVDPNLIFSVHPYWGISDGANAAFIEAQFDAAFDANIALIIGEFSQWGAYNGNTSICVGNGETDYTAIMTKATEHGFGWYAWEWGPGNEFGDPNCAKMNMTTNGTITTLQPGWATDVVNRIKTESIPILG